MDIPLTHPVPQLYHPHCRHFGHAKPIPSASRRLWRQPLAHTCLIVQCACTAITCQSMIDRGDLDADVRLQEVFVAALWAPSLEIPEVDLGSGVSAFAAAAADCTSLWLHQPTYHDP